MKNYKAVFFWFGGVLTQTLSELTAARLLPETSGGHAVKTRRQLHTLAEQMVLGSMAADAYCEQAVKQCEAQASPSELPRQLVDSAVLNDAIARVIADIPASYERWLVVDYPQEWYQALADRWDLQALFANERVVLLSNLGLITLVPDIYYHLPRVAGRLMDDCIVIDADSERSVNAMKHGLASIIYVYPGRLKLELALQGIWQTEADVMHPTSSQRVEI